MTFEIWLAYAVACTVLLITPGPTILLVMSYALSQGRRTAWATVPGVALGDTTAVTLSLLGVGALLAVSAELFTILKWIGAGYLVWLGIGMIRAKPRLIAPDLEGKEAPRLEGGWKMFWHSYVVTTLNPKGIVFFVAFLPQFIVAQAPVTPQLLILAVTFVVLAVANCLAYALIAGTLRERIARPSVLGLLNKAGGGVLILAGVMMATVRRQA